MPIFPQPEMLFLLPSFAFISITEDRRPPLEIGKSLLYTSIALVVSGIIVEYKPIRCEGL